MNNQFAVISSKALPRYSVSELGKTTLEAQTMANEKITKLKELVKTL